jgi:uncharacterized membrane protein YfcA
MSPLRVLVLALVSLCGGVLSSITGGTSLLTVPAMLLAGMEPHVAVGTNMLVVAALSAGSAGRFATAAALPSRPTLVLAITAVPGSLLGALSAVALPETTLRIVISAAMLAMAALLGFRPTLGQERVRVSRRLSFLGTCLLALWALYGGLFSGGYATVLTLGIIVFFGSPLSEAVGIAKVVNLTGSAAAVLVFVWCKKVDWVVGGSMGASAAVGGWIGATVSLRAKPEFIRRLFATVIAAIGIKFGYDRLNPGHRGQ